MRRSLLVLTAALLAPTVPAQEEPVEPASPLERFRALDEVDQSTIVRGITRRLSLDPDPVIQRIVSMERGFHGYELAKPATWHRAARWAKGVAPKRKLVRAGTKPHDAARTVIPPVPFLPELTRAVWYDWGRGEIVRRAKPLALDEVFANFLAGFAPGTDQTVAQILAILDADGKQRKVAAYAEHLYADLNAKVYEGITIWEAWYSEKVLDVPDVDAIPFAVQILKTRAYVSPIPAGPRREALYEKIKRAMFSYRKHRTLREAAAAAFVAAEPVLDATYEPLVPRFHWLYAEKEEDPLAVARELASLADREAFLRWADENVKESRSAYDRREARQNGLARMAMMIRRMALQALER